MLEGDASTHIIQAVKKIESVKIVFKEEGQVSMPGVPDIYVDDEVSGAFWIEVKLVKKYPKRSNSIILEHDFSPEQIRFFNKTSTKSFAIIADIADGKKLEFRIVPKKKIKCKMNLSEFKELKIWGGEKFW